MAIYRKRDEGIEVQSFTCRLPKNLYDEIKEFAYKERVSLSLGLEKLITEGFKAIQDSKTKDT